MKRVNYLSINLLLSYLSLLAAPLLAIIIIYFTSSNLLLNIQTEKLQAGLNETAQEVDKHLEEAGNLCIYISNSRDLQEITYQEEQNKKQTSFYDMYLLSRNFPDYSGFNNAIQDIYIFFSEEDYIMKLPAVVPAEERSYQTLGSLSKDSYELICTQLESKYWEKIPFSLEQSNGNDRHLAIAQSFPHGTYGKPKGTVVALLDDNLLMKKLETNMIGEEGITLMLDGNNKIQKIAKGSKCKIEASQIDFKKIKDKGITNLTIGGDTYIASLSGGNTIYQYLTLLPRTTLLKQIGYIKYVIVLLCAVSVIFGIVSCVVLWRKRRGLLLAYSNYQDQFGTVIQEGNQVKTLWEGMRGVMEYVVEIQATLKLQQLFIRSAVMRKLLYGEYQELEELEGDMKKAQISLEGDGFYVAVLSFHKEAKGFQSEKRSEFQLFMKEQTKEKIPVPHYYCELEPFMTALVLPVTKSGSLATIKELLRRFEDELVAKQYVEAYISVGKKASSLLEISLSYEDAMEVLNYCSFHDIRMVMSKEDLPKKQDSFFFPMETEIHLIRAIKQGDRSELEDLKRLICYENFTYRKLSVTMAGHLAELIRCTAIRALREEKGLTCQELIEEIGRSEQVESIFDSLFQVAFVIQERDKREQDKKTARQKEAYAEFIQEWYHRDEFNISNLADQFGIPERRAYQEFKSCFGITFSEYLENIRIQKACELLKQGVSVKDVAERTGYGSDYSFRRAFKRVMGLAPSYYTQGLLK